MKEWACDSAHVTMIGPVLCSSVYILSMPKSCDEGMPVHMRRSSIFPWRAIKEAEDPTPGGRQRKKSSQLSHSCRLLFPFEVIVNSKYNKKKKNTQVHTYLYSAVELHRAVLNLVFWEHKYIEWFSIWDRKAVHGAVNAMPQRADDEDMSSARMERWHAMNTWKNVHAPVRSLHWFWLDSNSTPKVRQKVKKEEHIYWFLIVLAT